MEIYAINLEAGKPTVQQAASRLNAELRRAQAGRIRVVKLIHGYGSSGPGGAIKAFVQQSLAQRKRAGQIREFVRGEDFSPFSAAARAIVDACPEAARDRDYTRANHGVTIVLL